jgi:uracil-DNA glycosylase
VARTAKGRVPVDGLTGQGALFCADEPVPVGEGLAAMDAPALSTKLAVLFDAVAPDWRGLTEGFRADPVGQALIARVDAARASGLVVYPDDVFAALRLTRRADVRVVILGQDPYHGPGQAHGLAFSVRPGVPIPPSLRNIRKEIQRDLGLSLPEHGCLQAWAEQGVLLLNTVLTVTQAEAASHAKWGWEALTDALVQALAADPGPRVFMLWGAHAQRKLPLITAAASQGGSPDRHLILQSNHPSPLSALRGPEPFLGNAHFGQAQAFWHEKGQRLDWSLA